MATSPSPGPSSGPSNRHAPTALERQRMQLDRLLKDPAKPAYIPTPPKDRTIRPAREMMKNVQGSSAGAGSGEFHVYKASRRREYERLKLMDDQAQKEIAEREFEDKKRVWEEAADAKTAKNRAKRLKKKNRAKASTESKDQGKGTEAVPGRNTGGEVPLKKRRLVNGTEVVFRKPREGDEGSEDEEDEDEPGPVPLEPSGSSIPDGRVNSEYPQEFNDTGRITIHEDD